MTSPVFYIQYEARPMQQNELWGEAGGAFVHCYCVASGPETAAKMTFDALCEQQWEVLSVEKGPHELRRGELGDSEEQEHFDTAVSDGKCFVYYLWPEEPQDDDTH